MIPPASPHAGPRARIELKTFPGKLDQSDQMLAARAARRSYRHRPHPLGDAWRADRGQCASARLGRGSPSCASGIIENFRELKDELIKKGHRFQSETDSEVAAHLVTDYLDQGLSPEEAAKTAVRRLTGAYSLVMIFKGKDNLLIGARRGEPARGGLWRA